MVWSWKRKPRKTKEEKQKERTKRVAYELYQNRLLLSRPGNSESDWNKAEKIVGNPLRSVLFIGHLSLIKLEKRLWEPILNWGN